VADRLELELVTPRRRILSESVDEVRLPGVLGEMGVLPGHAPLLTSLGTGPLAFTQGGREQRLAVQGGFAEVLPDRVTVLATLAEFPEEIDVADARKQRAESEEKLGSAEAEEIATLSDEVMMAVTRIDVAGGGD
jgi:F-type H+-transporting ATPase subunit epsilon